MAASNIREINIEENNDRASGMARRAEREQAEKHRARDRVTALRGQMQNGDDQVQNDNVEESKTIPRKCKIAILAVLMIAFVGGAVAIFGTIGSPSSSAAAAAAVTTDAPVSVIPTEAPTPLPSLTPTVASTLEVIYPKPSPQACAQVAAGQPVLGQRSLATRSFNVELDVSLAAETDIDTMVDALQIQTQDILIPSLVGCNERRGLRAIVLRQSTTQRRRYAIANAEATVVHDPSQTCVPTGSGPCYRVVTTLNVFIKNATESEQVLNNLIVGVYDVEALSVDLGIGALIDSISFEDILLAQQEPTNSPTRAPVSSPTVSPISAPTLPPAVSTLPQTPGPALTPT
ncbi:unnamed protein product [Cylindrotheca closterium]|uniref:Uncharacterized protein n=1 Tax=Cylindrotheca closterium TaxID=2856 RepID=A0AAD2FGV0_9STRA|nr:unnamed protein product [Cylindrotheca closterium]